MITSEERAAHPWVEWLLLLRLVVPNRARPLTRVRGYLVQHQIHDLDRVQSRTLAELIARDQHGQLGRAE